MSDLQAVALLVVVVLGARWLPPQRLGTHPAHALESRWTPLVIGLLTAVVMTWVWGSLDQVAPIHDEASYLVQAKIFATGHWVAPGRPLPEFFEQYHVFVTPVLTSKYPPGHALLLVPGIWLGLPGLMPVVLAGVAGALLFVIARRLSNVWVALLAWLLWLTAPGVAEFIPSYMSETTSTVLWLVVLYALLEWRDGGDGRWLLAIGAALGYELLVRPMTSVMLAIPTGVVVLWLAAKHRSWRDVARAAAVGVVFVGVFLLWDNETTGSPLVSPYALYSKVYTPDDVLGFGITGKRPLRWETEDMQRFNEWVRAVHAQYTLETLPTQVLARVKYAGLDMWGGRMVFLPLAIIALLTTGAEIWFGFACAVALFTGYLSMGSPARWTIYYLELQPYFAFLSALGTWRVLSLVAERRTAERPLLSLATTPRLALAMLVITLGLAPYVSRAVPLVREGRFGWESYHRKFRTLLAAAPGSKIVVFVRYAPTHSPHNALITNEPDLQRARVWTVYDLGTAHDLDLMHLAPGRTPYLYDDEHSALVPLDGDARPQYGRALMLAPKDSVD